MDDIKEHFQQIQSECDENSKQRIKLVACIQNWISDENCLKNDNGLWTCNFAQPY